LKISKSSWIKKFKSAFFRFSIARRERREYGESQKDRRKSREEGNLETQRERGGRERRREERRMVRMSGA
jgi:hypothetical protein